MEHVPCIQAEFFYRSGPASIPTRALCCMSPPLSLPCLSSSCHDQIKAEITKINLQKKPLHRTRQHVVRLNSSWSSYFKNTLLYLINHYFLLFPFPSRSLWTSPGGDKLCHSQGAEVQPGHADFPPVARRPTGLRPKLRQQGGRQRICQRHDARPGGAQLPGHR